MSKWEKSGKTDEWYTPSYIFDSLGTYFDLDAAAPVNRQYCSVPADRFITEGSLNKVWEGYVWLNPPYGSRNSISAWLDKMADHYNGIALVPDRTSAPWWHKAVEGCTSVMFIHGKVKFIGYDGVVGDSPSNGSCLLSYGWRAHQDLVRARDRGLGKVMIRI